MTFNRWFRIMHKGPPDIPKIEDALAAINSSIVRIHPFDTTILFSSRRAECASLTLLLIAFGQIFKKCPY